jgi:hypothetical protein
VPNLSELLADALIVRGLALHRYEAGLRRDIRKQLAALTAELVARVTAVETFSRGQMALLLEDARRLVDRAYRGIVERQSTAAFDLAEAEGAFTVRVVNRTVDAELFKAATETVLRAIATDGLILGAPATEWWQRQAGDVAFRFAAEVRQGIAQQDALGTIVQRIRGSPAKGVPGVMPVSLRNAEALVRSSVASVSNASRRAVYDANSDVLDGVQQLSTLDGRTTPICVAYSGATWDLDGNPIRGTTLPFNGGPPRHFGCRSTLLPLVKAFDELGLDLKLPAAVRSSMDGQVAGDLSFADWLHGKPASFADEMLGHGRAQLWRDGRITLQQLLDQSGNELTLRELAQRFGG